MLVRSRPRAPAHHIGNRMKLQPHRYEKGTNLAPFDGKFRSLALAAFLMIGIAPVWAQDVPAAVGRITYGRMLRSGAAICSGALVAPDLLLTARHCVRAAMADPASMRFEAARSEGQALAEARGAQIILPESPEETASGPVNDVALVVLDHPIPSEVVPPLALADPKTENHITRFTLAAYRRDKPELQQRSDSCDLIASVPGLLGLSCPVVSGNSGAPLLQWDGARWQIAAVMAAANRRGTVRSWAALIPISLRERIAEARLAE
jgi:protease YdgD